MAQMSDQEFERWLAQHGGEVGRKDNEEELDDPSDTGPLAPGEKRRRIRRVESTTVTAKDGATITLRRVQRIPGPDPGTPGAAPVDRPYDVIANTPPKAESAASDKEGDTRGPQNGPTREVYEGGRWVVKPNPIYQAPQQSGTIVERNGRTFIIKPDGNAQEVNGVPAETPKGTLVERQDGTYLVSADGKSATKVLGLPAKEAQSPYSQTVQDPDTRIWWGLKRDGSGWVQLPPGGPGSPSGQPRSPGPAFPTIIIGQSEQALRGYADQLSAEVAAGRMTPAERERRLKEALEVAGQVASEARLLQEERQSNLNARVNLATTKLQAEQSGLQTALKFALDLNDSLPVGSSLGGQAFAAALQLSLLSAKRSGIYDINPPNESYPGSSMAGRGIESAAQAAAATTRNAITRLTNVNDRATLEAERQQIAAQLAAEVNPPAVPAAPAVPVAPSAPVAPAPPVAAGAPGVPVVPPAAPVPVPTPSVVAPPSMAAAGPDPSAGAPLLHERVYREDVLPTGHERVYREEILPAPVPGPTSEPNPGLPGGPPARVLPPPASETVPPLPPNEITRMAPVPDFAVLAQYQRPQQDVPQPLMPEPMQQSEHPAILHSRAATTVPWRMTPDEIERYRRAGVPDETIWSVPELIA